MTIAFRVLRRIVARFGAPGRSLARRWDRDRRRPSLRSQRWIENALAARRAEPIWIDLRGGSMSPSIEDGSRLLVRAFGSQDEPRLGDVVIVRRDGMIVAHRVVRRSGDAVVTRGDACATDDRPVAISSLLARVVAVNAPRRPEHERRT